MLPYFYIEDFDSGQRYLTLNETNSRHAVQVLRMKSGAPLHLTDGQGKLLTASIIRDHKKHCEVEVLQVVLQPVVAPEVTIALAPTKNNSRFEWFLEKATELGVHRLIPLITHRSEKQKLKAERLRQILISSMLQSRQCRLPELWEPLPFEQIFQQDFLQDMAHKYIAHCIESEKHFLGYQKAPSLILIGPEGDFTPGEIALALDRGFDPVSLGGTRLRTETAGIAAATLLRVPRD